MGTHTLCFLADCNPRNFSLSQNKVACFLLVFNAPSRQALKCNLYLAEARAQGSESSRGKVKLSQSFWAKKSHKYTPPCFSSGLGTGACCLPDSWGRASGIAQGDLGQQTVYCFSKSSVFAASHQEKCESCSTAAFQRKHGMRFPLPKRYFGIPLSVKGLESR